MCVLCTLAKTSLLVKKKKTRLFFLRSSLLFRVFYIPFLSDHHTTYRRYVILKPRRQKQPRKRTHGWPLNLHVLPKCKIFNDRNQSLPLKKSWRVCVSVWLMNTCACMCSIVFVSWNIWRWLKISHPLRTLCLLLGLFVCAWEREMCRYAGMRGRYQLDLFVNILSLVFVCVNECLTVSAHYKISHVLNPGQAVAHTQ